MAHENWNRVESLFHAACGMSAQDRAEYLRRLCAEEPRLREDVEALLSAHDANPQFMAQPAFSLGLRVISMSSITESLVGKRIGDYQILARLGRGGMGEVYLAEDGRLGRRVALKFLSHKLADDAWGKRQLRKEAQSAARLDHPNICAVYGLEELDGYSFIVMQYVEGETLSSHIRNRTIQPEHLRSLALQITSALAEAHAHGIIHRDIKPQNIMVSTGGQAKVLDFGLAKSIRQSSLAGADSESHVSDPGLVRGTIGYMSPEQLRAERLDYRSDIFSLGTLFYELFAGENPFARASGAETISAILTNQPTPIRNVAPGVSTGLERIIHKCLNKDRAGRFYSASELLYELGALQQENDPQPRRRQYSNLGAFAAFSALILLATVLAFVYLHQPEVTPGDNVAAKPSSRAPAAAVHSLAVLPISAEVAGENLEYLADGLAESLIGKLSSLPELEVKAFTSVSGYKGKAIAPQSVGRQLNVDTLLLGKIIRRQNSLALESRLLRAEDGSQVWAGAHEIQLADALGLPDVIAKSVIDSLKLRSADERTLLASRGTTNPEAFRLYMGRIEEALGIFQRLYKKNKALAGAALGYAYGKKGRIKEARKVLAEMEDLSRQRYVPPQEFAIIYAGLGDNDNAFKFLEKAYQERFPTLAYLAVDPIFSGLHSDARYVALTERLKLSPQKP